MANSFLLGGFRLYIPDEEGNPLNKGRVSFFISGTSTPATVYKDMDMTTAWGTSVPVDGNGYIGGATSSGVWLRKNVRYKVFVEKYLYTDPSSGNEVWESLWSVDGVGEDKQSLDIPTFRFNTVDNIAALKNVDYNNIDYVTVCGWYNPGDTGTPMFFRWSANADSNDNGHFIKPNGIGGDNGRWEQLFGSVIDVCKFGAIPNKDLFLDSAIINAVTYAKELSEHESGYVPVPKEVHFSKSGSYLISGNINFDYYRSSQQYGNLNVPIVVHDGVVFSSSSEVYVKFGNGTRILSSHPIVSESVELKFVEDSMEYVRPQWWYGSVFSNVLAKAYASENNVWVYGDMSNYSDRTSIANELKINGLVRGDEGVFAGVFFGKDSSGNPVVKKGGTERIVFKNSESEFKGANRFSHDGSVDFDGDVNFNNGFEVTDGDAVLKGVTAESIITGTIGATDAVTAVKLSANTIDLSSSGFKFYIKKGMIKNQMTKLFSLPSLFPDVSVGDVVHVVMQKAARVALDGSINFTYAEFSGSGIQGFLCFDKESDGTPYFIPVGANAKLTVNPNNPKWSGWG